MVIKNKILAAAFAAAALVTPNFSNALTLAFESASGGYFEIQDGGVGDLDNTVNGDILASDVAVGLGFVDIATSLIVDESGFSKIVLNVSDAIADALEGFNIAAYHDFSGAAAAPELTSLELDMNASDISQGGQVFGHFGYGDGGTSVGALNYTAFESLLAPGDDIHQTLSTALNDPYRLIINTFVSAGTTASYDATLTAAVPLPAAGLMLLAGLGGLGALRRRKG